MSQKSPLGEIAKRALDASIHAARSVASEHGALCPYERVLAVVRARTGLLARRAVHGVYAANRAILALALEHEAWLAPVETWQPRPAPTRPVLASLAEHLLARYPLPALMASVWHEGEPGAATREQRWYKQLGLGESLRRIGLPLPLTRAMAHRFLSAPCHLGMVAGLRWAQLTELGASAPLRDEVLRTRLGTALDDEGYWEAVLHFFVNQPLLPLDEVRPIVDFLDQEKLPIKGRSCASLIRLVREWHRELGRVAAANVAWAPAAIRGFTWLEKRRPARQQHRPDEEPLDEDRTWRIEELCSNRALVLEGRAMRHCVATYVRECVQGRSSIWSLQAEVRGLRTRALTLEVDPRVRRLVQARRRHNGSPSPAERAIVRRWAEREGIIIPPALRDLQ